MPVNKGKLFLHSNVYIDYPFETVMYRWDYKSETIYRTFYGEDEQITPVPHDNSLFNEALLAGTLITKEEYDKGKK